MQGIFFQRSHQVPMDCCKDLKSLFIKTWVRTAGEITSLLAQLKEAITESSEQAHLNHIITSLPFK